MFDRALNALICIDCLIVYLMAKKDNLRLGKLIDK